MVKHRKGISIDVDDERWISICLKKRIQIPMPRILANNNINAMLSEWILLLWHKNNGKYHMHEATFSHRFSLHWVVKFERCIEHRCEHMINSWENMNEYALKFEMHGRCTCHSARYQWNGLTDSPKSEHDIECHYDHCISPPHVHDQCNNNAIRSFVQKL